jgi:hypothetical protein
MFGPSLCNDSEIIGRIWCQFCNLNIKDYLPTNINGEIIECITSLMTKLQTLKYHSEKYGKLEDELFIESVKRFQENPSSTRIAIELVSEIEAFFMQLKSCLDILAKILVPTVGKGFIKTNTFGNKGEDIIKGLNNYKNKKGSNQRAIEALKSLIQEDKDRWLTDIINLRDTIAHYKPLGNYFFKPMENADGSITAIRPTFDGHDTKVILNILYQNTIYFCQDFMSISLLFPMPPAIGLNLASETQMKENFGDHGKYIKYSFF